MPYTVRKVNAMVKDPDSGQMIPAGLLGSDALSAIDTAKNQAITAIVEQGEDTIRSIPPEYTDLTNKVGGLETQINYAAGNRGDAIEAEFISGYFINLSGVITRAVSGGWAYSNPIPIKANDTIKIKARGMNGNTAMILTCDSEGENRVVCKGANVSTVAEYEYTVISDTYVIISCDMDFDYASCIIHPTDKTLTLENFAADAKKVGEEISQLDDKAEEFREKSDYFSETFGGVVYGDFVPDYYITNNGVVTAIATGGWAYSRPITLNSGNAIHVKARGMNGGVAIICTSDANGENLTVRKVATSSAVADYEYTATENTYVVICADMDYDFAMYITVPQISIDWSGLTWALIGDSLTQKNYRAATSYYDYIKADTGINLINEGVSGGGYARSNAAFYTEIGNLQNQTFDFATIFGSGNDCNWQTIFPNAESWQEALGDVTDNGTSTICGYINRAIDRYFTLFPLKKLGIITPTPWAEYSNTETGTINGTVMDDYSKKLKQICEMRGIPCLDLYHESGMRPWNEDFRVEYYKENNIQDNGVHPNSKGHKWFYKMFMEFINQYLIPSD